MKWSKAFWLTGFATTMLVLAFLMFRPVPVPSNQEELLFLQGTLVRIDSATTSDLIIALQEHPQQFYINRGMEKGAGKRIFRHRQELLGDQVLLGFPDYWTPLNPNNSVRHLSYLQWGDSLIFSEIKAR